MNLNRLLPGLLLVLLGSAAQAQTGSVGIGTSSPHAKAALDISTTTKGLLLPRLTQAQRLALSAGPATTPPGLTVFQTGPDSVGVWAYSGLHWLWLNGSGGDNLGSHLATQNLDLGLHQLVGTAGFSPTPGLGVSANGGVSMSTASGSNWIAANVGTATGDRVVSGNLGGRATLGAHNEQLSAWSVLYLNPGGPVSVGNYPVVGDPSRLVVEGQVASYADANGLGGFVFPDGSAQTTAAHDAQQLSRSGNIISLTNGGSVLDSDGQQLSKSNDTIRLANGGFVRDSDGQQLTRTGNYINLTNGGSVVDNDFQGLSKAGNVISLVNGGSVIDSDDQQLRRSGNVVSLTNGGSFTDNDFQGLSKAGNVISLVNGGSVVDSDDQTLSISGSTLSLSNGGSVVLPSAGDNLGNHTATQNLSLGAYLLQGTGPTSTPAGTGVSVSAAGQLRASIGSGGGWIAANVGGAGGRVVSGELNGVPTLGGHTNDLSAWTDLALNPGGNVGIGHNAPGARLDVRGPGGLRVYTTNTGATGGMAGLTDWYSSFGGQANTAMDRVALGTYNGQATIAGLGFNAGNVGINPANLLLNPSGGSVGIGTINPIATFYVNGSGFFATTLAVGSNFAANGNATVGGRLAVSGQVSFCGGAYSCSDRRYKRDVRPLRGALQNVLALSGYTYFWKREEFPGKQFTADRQLGFIAQEVEALYPEMVSTDEETGYKSVDYSRMTPVLLEALKELKTQLDQSRAEAHAATTATAELLRRVQALEGQGARAGR